MKLAFTLEYDGTDFSGFQSQKNSITIQDHIERAIEKITKELTTKNIYIKKIPIDLYGCQSWEI